MREEGIKSFLHFLEVLVILKKWGLSISKDIGNILTMVHINDIILYVDNKLPIRKYGRTKRDQTSKYKILNIGTYYVHYHWDKKHTVRNKAEVTCPMYE